MKKKYGAVSAVVKATDGRWVMLWHDKRQCWTIPMGKVDGVEGPAEALRRELLEEVGLDLSIARLGVALATPLESYDEALVQQHLFLLELKEGETIKNMDPEKHTCGCFLTKEDIGLSLSPLSKITLTALRTVK